MNEIHELTRPNILAMKAYSAGKSEFSGKAEIILDTNENPYGDGVLNRYPDPVQAKLRRKIAAVKSAQFDTEVSEENIALGNGSDELIDQLVRVFCEPCEDALAWCPPTFGMYGVVADLNNVKKYEIALDSSFDLDLSALRATPPGKILFLCSPNNPTGNAISPERLWGVLEEFPGIVVLDEAYIDFCPERSLLPKLKSYPQLVILQTFSKAWGMAGARLGMAFAHPEIISLLDKVRMPYNIGVLKEKFVLGKLTDPAVFERERDLILAERDRLRALLEPLPSVEKIFPSDSNFLLTRFKNGNSIYKKLLENGIVVRNFSDKPRLENCLRITVGTAEENNRFLDVLSRSA